jgi:hypothetical protein
MNLIEFNKYRITANGNIFLKNFIHQTGIQTPSLMNNPGKKVKTRSDPEI